jgi:hypothetical protein
VLALGAGLGVVWVALRRWTTDAVANDDARAADAVD